VSKKQSHKGKSENKEIETENNSEYALGIQSNESFKCPDRLKKKRFFLI